MHFIEMEMGKASEIIANYMRKQKRNVKQERKTKKKPKKKLRTQNAPATSRFNACWIDGEYVHSVWVCVWLGSEALQTPNANTGGL